MGHSSDSIVELRQYTLRPGQRPVLLELFEEHFVGAQEDLGITVLGTFRDLADEDRFVWLRSFPNVQERGRSLKAFYGGPVWQDHRDVANATMVDSDDVLMLEVATRSQPLPPRFCRPAHGASFPGTTRVHLQVLLVDDAISPKLASIAAALAPDLNAAFGWDVSILRTSTQPNNFPSLPIRVDDHALVCLAVLPDAASLRRGRVRAAHAVDRLRTKLGSHLVGEQSLELEPTSRS